MLLLLNLIIVVVLVKPRLEKKTKFRDGLADIFIEALQSKRDKPLTPKQIAAARGQATKVLNSTKAIKRLRKQYIKALKTVHESKPSTKKKKAEAEAKKTEKTEDTENH